MEQFFTFVVHHWFLWSLLVLIIVLIALLEAQKNLGGGASLQSQQVVNMMNHDGAKVIDIRSVDNFRAGHILGAQNIPAADLANKLAKAQKQKPLILVCATGAESVKAAKELKQLNFEKVYNLQGGMASWKNANLPVTKD